MWQVGQRSQSLVAGGHISQSAIDRNLAEGDVSKEDPAKGRPLFTFNEGAWRDGTGLVSIVLLSPSESVVSARKSWANC